MVDELAGAAELVMGKADGIPVAVVRGVDPAWFRRGEVAAPRSSAPPPRTSSGSAVRRCGGSSMARRGHAGAGLGAGGEVAEAGLGLPEPVLGPAPQVGVAERLAQLGELDDQDVELVDGVSKVHNEPYGRFAC